jgi:hypothetical protein
MIDLGMDKLLLTIFVVANEGSEMGRPMPLRGHSMSLRGCWKGKREEWFVHP